MHNRLPPNSPSPDETVRKAVDDPFVLLPPEWRIPAWRFWAHYSLLLPNQLALAVSLRDWIDRDGLTLDDAATAMRHCATAEETAKVKYPGDVIARLAGVVAHLIDRRKSLSGMLSRRSKELPQPTPKYLQGIGEMPT